MDARDLFQHSLFVSYAHEDKAVLAELLKYFIPLERAVGCKVLWEDGLIRTGDVWGDEIDQALSKARYAVLLMSVDFMASTFINDKELPRLRARERAGELKILTLLVNPVDMELTGVSDLQFVNAEHPLQDLEPVAQKGLYLKLAMHVKGEMRRLAGAANDHSAAPNVPGAASPSLEVPIPAQAAKPVDALPYEAGTPGELVDEADLQVDGTAVRSAVWEASIPPHLAVAEIESQLLRLKQHTRTIGFAVFDCGGYYVQFQYVPALDDSSMVMEVMSNVYLEKTGERLGKMQVRHLMGDLNFVQGAPDMNLLKNAVLTDATDFADIALQTWTILTELYPSEEGAPLSIVAECY